jgi:hypothetical protein
MMLWLAAALAAPFTVTVDPYEACVARSDVPVRHAPVGPRVGRAVVVGVPCHRDPAIQELAYAAVDADRVAARLAASGFDVDVLAGGVDRDTLLAALDAAAADAGPEETLVVYFSGHGLLAETAEGTVRHLVLSDTRLAELGRTGLTADQVESWLSSVPVAERVLIQDTCFAATSSELGKSATVRSGHKGLAVREPPLRQGDLRLYAARFYQLATEEPELGGSLYTHELLAALDDTGADLDGDGCVGLVEAHRVATAHTRRIRSDLQVPAMRSLDPDAAALTERCTGTPTRAVVLDPVREGLAVALQDDGGPVAAGSLAPGRVRLTLQAEPSWRREQPQVLVDEAVRLEAGTWLQPETLVAARRPFGLLEASAVTMPVADVLPPVSAALAGWWLSRALRGGRWTAGGEVGVAPPATLSAARFSAGWSRVQAGWLARRSVGDLELAGGPVVGVGVWGRTPVGERAFPTQWSAGGTLGLRGHLAWRRLVGTLQVDAWGLAKDGRIVVRPAPRLGLGVRL